ncbi:MAG TPA: DUF5985 family protein [Polyangiaceae bacterium]|jgi:hypothetical protein
MIAAAVYVLCALTSIACAVLLLLGWRRSRQRLLMWSGLCFAAFAINNVLLFVDMIVVPTVDISVIRTVPSVLGVAVLVWGFVWDTE